MNIKSCPKIAENGQKAKNKAEKYELPEKAENGSKFGHDFWALSSVLSNIFQKKIVKMTQILKLCSHGL